MDERFCLQVLGVQLIVLCPHAGEWKWSIRLSRCDEFHLRTLGRLLYLRAVHVGQRLDEGVPVALMLRDVVAQASDQCIAVSLCQAAGLRMTSGRRDMLDAHAGHHMLKIAGCDLWPVVG